MLATYPVKIINNQIQWVGTPPDFSVITEGVFVVSSGILPTVSEQKTTVKREPPKQLQGLMTIHGDIFDTSESYQEWEHYE